MNSSGCPLSAWLLCLQYVCGLLNHMSSPVLDGLPPLQALTGQTPGISFLLHFSFWEPVYYRVNPNEPSSNFPSTSNERKGYWVGFSDIVGDKLTWKILTGDTNYLIFRSAVRSANNSTPNLHHELPSEESNLPNSNPISHEDSPDIPDQNFLWSQPECEDNSSLNPNPTPMATFTVDDLVARSFLLPSGQDYHEKIRATVTKRFEELDQDSANRGEHTNFFSSSTTRKMLNRLSRIINFLIILKRMNHS